MLEDIDWLFDDWWIGQPDELTEGDIRRGSAAIHLLLVQDSLGKAWRHYGFQRQPRIVGPDLHAFSEHEGFRLELSPAFAGGGRQNSVDLAFVGAARVDNPSTGIPADADEGFAVRVTGTTRIASDTPEDSPLNSLFNRQWLLSDYLESPAAVRRGSVIKRREIIKYFRNAAGGAHLTLASQPRPEEDRQRHELIAELHKYLRAGLRDGLYFELLSIGQSVARSDDIRALAERMRRDS